MKTTKDVLLDKLLYIGDEIPISIVHDIRPKFVLLGTPQELLDELDNVEKEVKYEKEPCK